MSKRVGNFKKETKLKSGWCWNREQTLKNMDDFFKEESERYRRMRKK